MGGERVRGEEPLAQRPRRKWDCQHFSVEALIVSTTLYGTLSSLFLDAGCGAKSLTAAG